MAMSIQHDLVSAVEHEISCPICFEDFEEPKCLPNCAHNVCQHCLEGMVKKKKKIIECPVCRVGSVIPQGGVAAFPKNHLLVRLIEQSPGRKEKQSIQQAMKNCNEKLEGVKAALEELEDRYSIIKIQNEEIKQRIQFVGKNVVRMVRDQERKMLGEINLRQNQHERTFQNLKSTTVELCESASGCIQTVQDILQGGELSELKNIKDSLVKEMKDFSKLLEKRKLKVNCEVYTQPLDISLTDTDSVEKLVEDVSCLLGKLNINTGLASTPQDVPTASVIWKATPVTPKGKDYSRCGSLIQTIDSFSHGIAKFAPFSVAASRHSGNIVALDEQMKRVHIFNEEGEALNKFPIKYGDLWDIAVSNEDEIVVVNREKNRLLHYDMHGNFQKKVFSAPEENVKFTSCTVDVHGRFIITSMPCYEETEDDTMSCILVYTPSGKLTLSFSKENLSPRKAVFLNGKFYVTDSEFGSVQVFDKRGSFLNALEDDQLVSPSCIAADYGNGKLVVSDSGNSTVHIYSQEGQLLHYFQTEHDPIQVAFTKNYENLLICCEVDDDNAYIQKLAYMNS